eukprot:COSAG05_NODE_7718_length_777_cov_0.609145_1_plen_23_part_10
MKVEGLWGLRGCGVCQEKLKMKS